VLGVLACQLGEIGVALVARERVLRTWGGHETGDEQQTYGEASHAASSSLFAGTLAVRRAPYYARMTTAIRTRPGRLFPARESVEVLLARAAVAAMMYQISDLVCAILNHTLDRSQSPY